MTDTKRVDELEVGDVVIFAGSKGSSTVSSIETKVDEVDIRYLLFVIHTEETEKPLTYLGEAQVTYLCNNKKEKETMQIQKVDSSALYPYFDLLAGDEINLEGATNIPVYVRQQLKHIHELFENVLGLTLGEVKTLYFERKMSKSKIDKKNENSEFTIKKAKELCIGDIVVLFAEDCVTQAVKICALRSLIPQKIRFDWEDCYAIYDLEAEVKILKSC